MKIILTLLSLLPLVTSQCAFCPSGVIPEMASVVITEDGITCEGMVQAAVDSGFADDSIDCATLKSGLHPVCCPSDSGPGCNFCPTGVEAPDLVLDQSGTTCSSLAFISQNAFAPLCAGVEAADPTCCPEKAGTICDMCPSGNVDETALVDFGDGEVPCGNLIAYARSLSSEIDQCNDILFGQAQCCPDDVGDGCPFCADGVTNPDFVVDGDGTSCADLVDLSVISPQGLCDQFAQANAVCCPPTPAPTAATPAPSTAPSEAPVPAPTAAPDSGASALASILGVVVVSSIGAMVM